MSPGATNENGSAEAPKVSEVPMVSHGKETFPDPAFVPNPTSLISGPWEISKVLDTIAVGRPAENTTSPVPYFHILERLKTMKREGWRRFGISRGESISDHMYRMAMMSMFAPASLRAQGLDLNRCMKMCLIHDMAEALVGDITPVDGVAKPEKSRREASTMDYITQNLLGRVENGDVGVEIRAIWQEYEDSKTLESKYVHDIDKMELLSQMIEYERRAETKLDLGEFSYVATRMVLPETRAWADEVLEERKKFWGGKSHTTWEEGEGGIAVEIKAMQDEYYSGEPEK